MYRSPAKIFFVSGLLALAVVAGSGCGDSGSTGTAFTPTPNQEKFYEQIGINTNSEGIPSIFTLPNVQTKLLISAATDQKNFSKEVSAGTKKLTKDKVGHHDWGEITLPATVSGILLQPQVKQTSADNQNKTTYDSDAFKVQLHRDVKYTFEVSRDLAHSITGFIPEISLYKVKQNLIDKDENSKSEEIKEYVSNFEVTAEPKENPSIVAFTITPENDGTYEVVISDSTDRVSPSDDNYILRIYPEQGLEGNYGHPVLYGFDENDNGNYLPLREVIVLRKMLANRGHGIDENGNVLQNGESYSHQHELNDFGFPIVGDCSEPHNIFDSRLADIKWRYSLADSEDKSLSYKDSEEAASVSDTEIVPVISDINWDSNMDNGSGYFALTGAQSNYRAIDNFDLDKIIQEPKISYNSHFITNKDEHEQEMNISASASYSGAAASVKAAASYSKNIKYSLCSTTLVMHYDKEDSVYQVADSYSLTREAKNYLKANGSEKFHERYGDYFVAGRRMGAKIDVYISIMTSSTEELEKVKTSIEGKAFDVTVGSEYANSVRDAIANKEVSVVIEQYGSLAPSGTSGKADLGTVNSEPIRLYMDQEGNFHPFTEELQAKCLSDGRIAPVSFKSDAGSVDSILQKMSDFINDSNKADFNNVTLQAQLRRYTFAKGGENIDSHISVAPDIFVASRGFCRELMGLSSYYNTAMSIPGGNIKDSENTRNSWKREYDDLVSEINSKLTSICSSIDSINSYKDKVVELSDKFRIIDERWVFYSMLMAQQSNSPQGYVNNGFKNFPLSAAVSNDYGEYKSQYEYEDWQIGWRKWHCEWTAPQDNVWAWLHADLRYGDYCTDENYPSLGKNYLHYRFNSNYDRHLEANMEGIPINLKDYPFIGLQQ